MSMPQNTLKVIAQANTQSQPCTRTMEVQPATALVELCSNQVSTSSLKGSWLDQVTSSVSWIMCRFRTHLATTFLAGGGTAKRLIRCGIHVRTSLFQADLFPRQLLLHQRRARPLARATTSASRTSVMKSLATARWTRPRARRHVQTLSLLTWLCENVPSS